MADSFTTGITSEISLGTAHALISAGTVLDQLMQIVPTALITLPKITMKSHVVYVILIGSAMVVNITRPHHMPHLLETVIQSAWEDVRVLLLATAFAV